MDIKSLMVGDWVFNKHHGKNIRLTQYDFFTHTHNEFGEQELAPFAKPTFGRDLEPIPLTPEILEKNFESESNIFGLQTYKLNDNFNLENRGDRFCLVRKCRAYYSSTFWICDLVHLHQLQHALRLCGIEKEIKLED